MISSKIIHIHCSGPTPRAPQGLPGPPSKGPPPPGDGGSFSRLAPGLVLSPTRQQGNTSRAAPLPEVISTRLAARNLDLCYFVGDDLDSSHVLCNENWADGSSEVSFLPQVVPYVINFALQGLRRYLNEMTLETNKVLGTNNFRLSWKGPYDRHDHWLEAPSNPGYDVQTFHAGYSACDAVVFLVFNKVRLRR